MTQGFCKDCTQKVEGQYILVSCAFSKWEGIWSPTESGSYREALREHDRAESTRLDDLARHEAGIHARRHALHVYRTTEPGDPRRRGIGVYL